MAQGLSSSLLPLYRKQLFCPNIMYFRRRGREVLTMSDDKHEPHWEWSFCSECKLTYTSAIKTGNEQKNSTKDDRLTGKKSSVTGKFDYLLAMVTDILSRVISRLCVHAFFTTAMFVESVIVLRLLVRRVFSLLFSLYYFRPLFWILKSIPFAASGLDSE